MDFDLVSASKYVRFFTKALSFPQRKSTAKQLKPRLASLGAISRNSPLLDSALCKRIMYGFRVDIT